MIRYARSHNKQTADIWTMFFLMLFPLSSLLGQAIECDKDAPMSRGASWSPDGRYIVFDSNRDRKQEIYIMKADGSDVKRLTFTDKKNYLPTISPNGKQILFMSYSDTLQAVYTMNIDGSDLRRITDTRHKYGDPAWSPDGKRIVVHSNRDSEAEEIYTLKPDGADLKRLTNNEAVDFVPRWSPDGKWIAFNSLRDGNREIYIMRPDGSEQTNITKDPLSNMVHNWSPDSKYIIFYAFAIKSSQLANKGVEKSLRMPLVRQTAELYVVDIETGQRIQLTHDFYWDQSPVFSPDGKKILFESCRSGNRETYVMNRDGSGITRLTFSDN